jgi:WD40 repeat protein
MAARIAHRSMKYNAFLSYNQKTDGRFAPAIEKALQRFAKPWYKLRAVHIFRDSSDLSATPNLWGKLETSLAESEYLLFMASPGSAASKWCRKEVAYWKANKSMDNFLVLLTDGDLVWDDAANDFDWEKSTALPEEECRGMFSAEPLYVDLRDDKRQTSYDLTNTAFRDHIVMIAATLHGKAAGDMIGEEIRQHRRTLRIRNAAIAVLTLLLLATVVASVVAIGQRNTAIRQLKRSESLRLAITAQAFQENEPTKALRLAEAAYRQTLPEPPPSKTLAVLAESFSSLADRNLILVAQSFEHPDRVTDASFVEGGQRILTLCSDGFEREWKLDGTILETRETAERKFASLGLFPESGYRLTLLEVDQVEEIPVEGQLAIIVAKIDGMLHFRVFNTEGEQTRDINENSIPEADRAELAALKTVFQEHWPPKTRLDQAVEEQLTKMVQSLLSDVIWETGKMARSPDGKSMLTVVHTGFSGANFTNRVLLKKRSGSEVRNLGEWHNEFVVSPQFSPKDQSVVFGAGSVVEIHPPSGFEPRKAIGHAAQISSVRLSPDGNCLLTASEDGTAKLWNMAGTALRLFGEYATRDVEWVMDYQLHLLSRASHDKLLDEGRSLIMLALIDGKLVVRAFDADGERFDPQGDPDYEPSHNLANLKRILATGDFAGPTELPRDREEQIIKAAVTVAQLSDPDALDQEGAFVEFCDSIVPKDGGPVVIQSADKSYALRIPIVRYEASDLILQHKGSQLLMKIPVTSILRESAAFSRNGEFVFIDRRKYYPTPEGAYGWLQKAQSIAPLTSKEIEEFEISD